MIAPTHITFAELIYLLILTTTGVSLNIVNALIIAIASLLADIDTNASITGKLVPFVSRRIERRFGHRTLTHSVPFICTLAVISLPLYALGSSPYACFIIGYASHPFLDTMTVNGVKLFYPFSNVKCVFPLEVNNPQRYRVQTRSRSDKTLGILFFIGCIPALFIAGQGYERFIRTTQQNIEAAVRDYNEFSRDHLVFAKISGYNMLTKEPFAGTVEVVGALDPHTLVAKGHDGRLHSFGKQFQADYVADNILCDRGMSSRSAIRSIDMSNRVLSQLAKFIDTSKEHYFFGELTTTDRLSLPEHTQLFSTISGSAGAVTFNYATYDDIHSLNIDHAFISKGILTVKSTLTGEHSDSVRQDNFAAPDSENFVQVVATLDAQESVNFLRAVGDTVVENEVLAKKNSGHHFDDAIRLNEDKIRLLEHQQTASDADFGQRIANAVQELRIDSAEVLRNIELFRSGYLSGEVLTQSELKLRKDARTLSQNLNVKTHSWEKYAHEIMKLRFANEQLKEKSESSEHFAEIRSTSGGIITDIRQMRHENKTQITFVIRRSP